MDKAYLRRLNNEKFQIAFKYVNEELKVDRQFNFNRQLSETVDTFLTRTELPRHAICGDVFQPGKNVVLEILNRKYDLLINSPWVDAISLPISILATFPLYPTKFEAVFTDKDLSVFTWSKSKDQKEWTVVGNNYIFTPSNEEIGHYLKLSCTPKNSTLEGPIIETVSTCTAEASPGLCPFEIRHQFTENKTEGKEFRVVTYNILADLYCDSDYTREVLHPYCPAYALKIDYRKQLILKEIIEIHCLTDIWEKIAKNSKLSERILGRTTTLQINVVESLEHKEVLVIGNTHLYFHPDANHIRLLHGGLAMRYLENFVDDLKKKITNKRISLVFCGDFNSVPECGIYKLFTTGEVPKDCIDYSSKQEESIEDVELKQSFKLNSACGTPKYTNFTAGFADCLDYIFYEQRNLAVSQVVPLPSHEEVTQHTALPSIVFPSDHISLVSDLKWR
ncbi:hypothetical protein NQ314_010884 [Rhamnusium bicolor]|uniref:2',5'-phosphodiesterase 12 n=1 Tax=Rhamnusium bicolor TaxID=1586634 RepID=A0AAV8XNL1_9CUCU|nr:hypothetical protein NQ314_010884 [Rhamnusium bicolor]